MCYFITIGLPKLKADIILNEIPKGLRFVATVNPNIISQLPENYIAHHVVSGMCSCDLFKSSKSNKAEKERESLLRKYKKKGWSEDKIKRALSDHENNIKKSFSGFREDIISWVTSLVQDLEQPLLLLVHMYSGAVETEEFQVKKRKIAVEDLVSFHKAFPEDTMVSISNRFNNDKIKAKAN